MTLWLKVVGAVVVAALALTAAIALPLTDWVGQFVAWIRSAGPIGVAAYAGAYVVATVFMLPGVVLTAGAGLAYGPVWGTILVSPISVVAATLAFVLGRTVARRWIADRTASSPRFRVVDAAVGRQGLKIVILLRLSPLFPFNLMNYALGLTGVRLRDYVLGSFIGMLPGTVLYVYIGSLVADVAALAGGTTEAGTARQILSGVGFAATVAVTVYVTRLARRALADALQVEQATGSDL